jgi:hypothetical protein
VAAKKFSPTPEAAPAAAPNTSETTAPRKPAPRKKAPPRKQNTEEPVLGLGPNAPAFFLRPVRSRTN